MVLVLIRPIWVVLPDGAPWWWCCLGTGSRAPTSTLKACCHALSTWWTAPVRFCPLARTANIDVRPPHPLNLRLSWPGAAVSSEIPLAQDDSTRRFVTPREKEEEQDGEEEEEQTLGRTRGETSSKTRTRNDVRSSMSRVAAFSGINVSVGGRSHQDQHREVSMAVSTREVYPPPCKMAVVQCMRPWLCTVAMA